MPAEMLQHMSEYEKIRARNIEENKRMLESLGLLRSFKPILEPIKKKHVAVVAKKKIPPAIKRTFEETKVKHAPALEEVIGNRIRRSLRVKGVEPDGSIILPPEEDLEYKPKRPKIKHDNIFGPIEGIPVGTHWETRMECSADGVHRPTVAGIHGNVPLGCYSIALSGGYEDDIDLGESFTYTGSGGRDLKGTSLNPKNLRTANQSKDQTLTRVNLALSLNVENREPVRVIRGYKCPSVFAPEYGYRYDGLYSVEKCWSAVGMSGYLVWKYILKRVPDQPPPPWKEAVYDTADTEEADIKEADSKEADIKEADTKEADTKVPSEESNNHVEDGEGTKVEDLIKPEYPLDEKKVDNEIVMEDEKVSNGDNDDGEHDDLESDKE